MKFVALLVLLSFSGLTTVRSAGIPHELRPMKHLAGSLVKTGDTVPAVPIQFTVVSLNYYVLGKTSNPFLNGILSKYFKTDLKITSNSYFTLRTSQFVWSVISVKICNSCTYTNGVTNCKNPLCGETNLLEEFVRKIISSSWMTLANNNVALIHLRYVNDPSEWIDLARTL
mgnify:CR=1 FL=1